MPKRASRRSSKPSERERRAVGVGGLRPARPGGLKASDYALLALLLLVTLLAYQPAWHGAPVWDDDGHLTRAELQSTDGLRRIWTEIGATQQYYPVVHSAFWVMHQLWGADTTGYHLVNICLHVLSAFLLMLVMKRLQLPGGWLAAFLFALHPVQVESVAWITELKNTLSTPLYLGSALAYLKFDESRRARHWVLAASLFVLALLSKTVTATLPISLLILAWWRRGRIDWSRDVRPVLPLLALAIAAGVLTSWVEHTFIGAQGRDFTLSPIERVLLAGRVFWFYAASLVWPVNLVFIYPQWNVSQAVWWQYLFPLSLAAVMIVLWRLRHRTRAPLSALLLYGAALAPALGFVNVYPFRFSYVADHFQYLASLAALAFVAAVVVRPRSDQGRTGVRPWSDPRLTPLVLAVLAVLTWHHSHQYKDAETLYRETLARNPSAWMAHHNLGILRLYAPEGDVRRALAHVEESLRLKQDNPEALNTRGLIRQKLGDLAGARADYDAAIRLNPTMASPHNNLGVLLYSQGRLDEAMTQYREAIRLHPRDPEAARNLGIVLLDLNRPSEAAAYLRRSYELNPNNPDLILNLGTLAVKEGRLEDAVREYQRAIAMRPDFAAAHASLGATLHGIGRVDEAIVAYRRAIDLSAPNAPADLHNSLGTALGERGRLREAIDEFNAALRIDPNHIHARRNLARAQGK